MRAVCQSASGEKEPVMAQTNPESGHRAGGACAGGCGLLLSGSGSDHRCVDALRAVTDALEGRSATLEQEARTARLRWNRREQRLLARVTALQDEARLATLQHQRRLHRYLLHIGSIAEQVSGYCKVRGAVPLCDVTCVRWPKAEQRAYISV